MKSTQQALNPQHGDDGANCEGELPVGMPTEVTQSFEALDEIDRRPRLGMAEIRALWEQRRLLWRAAAAGLAVATVVAFLIPVRYTAFAQLMPPDTQSVSSSLLLAGLAGKSSSGLGAAAGDLLGLKSSGALFVGMLRSRTIQDRLVQQFDLRKVYGTRLSEDAREQLNRNTGVAEDRKSGIITIAVTDRKAQRAAAIANAYAGELNSMVSELSTSSAHRERIFLEGRLLSVKQDLDDAEAQLAQFSSKNNTLDIQQQGKAMLDAAASLSGELIAAKSELEGLRQIYSDNSGRVRELSARVASLRKELDKLSGQNAAADAISAKARNAGDPSSDLPFPSIRQLPLLDAKYADFYRRAKVQETVFELLTEQFELAKVEEVKETPSVKVLDPATVPERKSYPPRLMIMYVGTFAALALSAIWALGVTAWQRVDSNDERKVFVREVIAAASSWNIGISKNESGGASVLQ
ncbi:MAG: Wzz/FepE/Etk N-terminal domain-containing protein, partial [Candidatus Acidiferrales bacterium]